MCIPRYEGVCTLAEHVLHLAPLASRGFEPASGSGRGTHDLVPVRSSAAARHDTQNERTGSAAASDARHEQVVDEVVVSPAVVGLFSYDSRALFL